MSILRNSLVALILASGAVHAGTLVQWTFDGATNPPDTSDSADAPIVVAAVGTGTLTGIHASDTSDWTTPAGNATSDAFSGNGWSVGDSFEFDFSTGGFYNITLDFEQASSTNGPKNFKVQTTNGSGYTDLTNGAYAVKRNFAPSVWDGSAYYTGYHLNFTLPTGISGVRLVVVDAVSETTPNITATGASRLDTVTISGDPTPEPGSIGLAFLGLGGLFVGARRRFVR